MLMPAAAVPGRLRAGSTPPQRPRRCSLRPATLQGEALPLPVVVAGRGVGEAGRGVRQGGRAHHLGRGYGWWQDASRTCRTARTTFGVPDRHGFRRMLRRFSKRGGAAWRKLAVRRSRALTGKRFALAGQLGGAISGSSAAEMPRQRSGAGGLAWICAAAALAARRLRIGTAAAGAGWRRRPGDWPPRCAPPLRGGHKLWRIASRIASSALLLRQTSPGQRAGLHHPWLMRRPAPAQQGD